MITESWPLTQAEDIGRLHVALNPDHVLALASCAGCDEPVGLICRTCQSALCAIDGEVH